MQIRPAAFFNVSLEALSFFPSGSCHQRCQPFTLLIRPCSPSFPSFLMVLLLIVPHPAGECDRSGMLLLVCFWLFVQRPAGIFSQNGRALPSGSATSVALRCACLQTESRRAAPRRPLCTSPVLKGDKRWHHQKPAPYMAAGAGF